MKNLICELILSCVVASGAGKPVPELTYGSMLYSYYQQDYQQALVEAMVAEKQNRRGEDPLRFELARGSFAFAERMFETARSAFADVDPASLSDLDRMRLAFHLAREFYRLGDYGGMAVELERIDLGRTWRGRLRVHPELNYLKAELALANGQLAHAEALLEPLTEQAPFRAYGLFNLGVAYRQVGDAAAAARVFGALSNTRSAEPEIVDLRQRARLALAYLAREQPQVLDPDVVLDDLPGEGRYQQVALASYGDLAMESGDYELAARIWLTLGQAPNWSRSTAQARLAFPASLEGMAATEMALDRYRDAERSFEERLTLLKDLRDRAQDPVWVRELLTVFAATEEREAGLDTVLAQWRDRLGHSDWLEWLATEQTNTLLVEWRELSAMQRWLDGLPSDLAAFGEVAAERRRRTTAAGHLLQDGDLLARKARFEQVVAGQAETLARLKATPAERRRDWMWALATDAERDRLAALHQARDRLQRLPDAGERQRWLNRIERLEGILFWQLADERAVRLRRLERRQAENAALLADIDAQVVRVAAAEQEFAAGVEADFGAFDERARNLMVQVDASLSQREVALAEELRDGMAREMQALERYLLATRIGIARTTDRLAAAPLTVDGE